MPSTSINARLGLNTQQFTTGLATARASVNQFTNAVSGQFMAAAGIAGMGAMVRAGVELGEELTNLSAIAGVSVEDFQMLAYAANTVGIESDALSQIYVDMNDRVGDFLNTGGGPMADFFEQIAPMVGVTAEEFRNLSGPDALQLYYDTLEEANLSQADMTFYMEAIASDATALIPLLANNGEEFRRLGEEASQSGTVMSNETAQAMSNLSDNSSQLATQMTVIAATITGNVLPVFTMLRSGLGFIADQAGYMGAAFYAALELIGNTVMTVINPAITGFQALSSGVEGTWHAINRDWDASNEAFDNAADLAAEAREQFQEIPAELSQHWTEYETQVNTSTELMGQSIEDRAEEVEAALDILSGAESERQAQLEKDREENEAAAEEARQAEAARLRAEVEESAAAHEARLAQHEAQLAAANEVRAAALAAAQAYRDETLDALDTRESIENRMGIVLEGSDEDIARLIELEQNGIVTGRALRDEERNTRQQERQLRQDTSEAAILQSKFNDTWINLTDSEREAARERQQQLQDFSGDLANWTDDQLLDWISLEEAAEFAEDAAGSLSDASESVADSTTGLSDAADDVVDAVNQLNESMDSPPPEWTWLAQRQDQIIEHLESIDEEVNRNP
jgi:hypothetical protein